MTQPSQLPHSATAIEEITTLFSQQLTSTQTWKRGPYKLDEALQQATSAPPQDTSAIFLSKGYSVWLAYFLAKSTHAVLYEDPRSHAEKLTAFEQLSAEDRTCVATRLARVDVPATLENTIFRIESILNPLKRRRLNSEQPSVLALGTNMRLPSETRDGFTTDYQAIGSNASVAEPSHVTAAIPTDASNVSNISNPATERLPPIFPLYMCGAISKIGDTANLTMTFPADDSGRIDCLMSLVISPNKVQHVARELFGTNLEIDGKIWYIIQENGGRLLPGPELYLQGAQDEGISKLLGSSVSSAIKGSPVRREEIKEAILATSCVTLIITRLPQDGGVLNLNLEIGEGFRLKRALFD